MRNLIRFFVNQHLIFLFILLEIVAFVMLVNNNYFQRVSVFSATKHVNILANRNILNVRDYFHLREVNEELVAENEKLQNQLQVFQAVDLLDYIIQDSANINKRYQYIKSKVINNSTNKQYNYITLNKGSNEGIEPEMMVVSHHNSFVGKVISVSNNFSLVRPFINRDSKVFANLKNNKISGSLEWTGRGISHANLDDIPFHVEINEGDSVVTSGLSDYFPEGILIGTVQDFKRETNFYHIKVKLATEFRQLSHVYVVVDKLRNEQVKLEEEVNND